MTHVLLGPTVALHSSSQSLAPCRAHSTPIMLNVYELRNPMTARMPTAGAMAPLTSPMAQMLAGSATLPTPMMALHRLNVDWSSDDPSLLGSSTAATAAAAATRGVSGRRAGTGAWLEWRNRT